MKKKNNNELSKTEQKKEKLGPIYWIFIAIVAIGIVYIAFIKFMCYKHSLTVVIGDSMYPTFKGNGKEYLLCNKNIEPKTGDLVTIKIDKNNMYTKRVIAVPGDVVSLEDGIICVNGEPSKYQLKEYKGKETEYLNKEGYKVEEGKYYCLGDNINISNDSKYLGTFERDKIRVVTKVWRLKFALPFCKKNI